MSSRVTCPLLCAALRPNENSVAEFQLGMLGSQVIPQRSQDIREFTGYSDSLQQAIAFIPRENERRTIRPFGIGPTLDINLAPLAEVVEYSSPPMLCRLEAVEIFQVVRPHPICSKLFALRLNFLRHVTCFLRGARQNCFQRQL